MDTQLPTNVTFPQYSICLEVLIECSVQSELISLLWLTKKVASTTPPKKNPFLSVSIQYYPEGWKPSKLQQTLQASSFFSSTQRNCVYLFWTKIMTEIRCGRRKFSSTTGKALAQRKMLSDQLTCPRRPPKSSLMTDTWSCRRNQFSTEKEK